MKKTVKHISVFAIFLMLWTCKKRPDSIVITAIDPFMNKPIPFAKIGLIQRSLNGGVFSGGYECKIIKSFETDECGNLSIEKAKFKTKKSVDYFVTVINAYGKDLTFSCGNRNEDDMLPKTNASITKKVYAYGVKIDWQFKINKLNSNGFGSLPSDYIMIKIFRDYTYYEDFVDNWNGSKAMVKQISLNKTVYDNLYNPTNPESYSCCPYNYIDDKLFPGNYRIEVTKNKNGTQTTYSYNEVVSPFNNIYNFNLDW